MTHSIQDTAASDFAQLLGQDGWTLALVGALIRQHAHATQASDEAVCCALLDWLEAVPHVGEHAAGRRFTRLQFMENSLSHAGYALTLRDFAAWLAASTSHQNGDWQPNALLPYTPQDLRLVESEARIEQLEHELHQAQVAANRARAEVNFVIAERDQFIATNTAEIYQLISQDYESSASWRVTQPLRRAMNGVREAKVWVRSLLSRGSAQSVASPASAGINPTSNMATDGVALTDAALAATPVSAAAPKWVTTAAPWNQPGYTTEAAWRAKAAEDFDRTDYTEWLRRYDTRSEADLAALRREADAWAHQPLLSVLMSMASTDGAAWQSLDKTLEALGAQIYPHWELCIAVAADVDAAARAALTQYAAMDARIKVLSGVSESNAKPLMASAHDAASGDWILLLNASDLIASHAFFMLARGINADQNWKIIYSDFDRLTGLGADRSQPNFKPDWDVDLFYAQNYTEHLCAFEAKLVAQAGGFDVLSGGVCTYDLTLRCIEHILAGQIGHIPQVLYHARDVHASYSKVHDITAKRQATLQAHFARRGVVAQVISLGQDLRVSYALPDQPPLVSVVIPTKNNARLLRQCLDSIFEKTDYRHFEVLVVDNGSDVPETLDYLKSLIGRPQIRVIRDNYAFNYSALNNAAVEQAQGEIVALVNDDIEVKAATWLTEMVGHAMRPGVGAVGARLWYPDMTLQHAGMVLVGGIARHVHKHLPQGEAGFNGRAQNTQSFTAVTGACLVVKKSLYEQVGGLNERELAIGFNDVDFCLRLVEAGYRNVWTPYAELIHHESATRGQDDSTEKQRRAEKELRYMRKRWGDRLLVDPAYNPNLTDGRDDFSFAWPPRAWQMGHMKT